MPSTSQLQGHDEAAPLFAALSDPTRLYLVSRLAAEGPQSISALGEHATISRQALTRHLRTLEDAGLAASRREGRERIFQLQPERLSDVHQYLDQIADQWNAALARLKAFVEDDPGSPST